MCDFCSPKTGILSDIAIYQQLKTMARTAFDYSYPSAAMKPLWCWRSKIEVPMLDEDEYKLVKDYVSAVYRLQDLFVPAPRVNVASLGQPVPETFVLNRCIRFPL